MSHWTLDRILNEPIIGNAYSDSELLDQIGQFAQDSNECIADRARAIRHLDDVMGLDPPFELSDDALVEQFMEDLRKNWL